METFAPRTGTPVKELQRVDGVSSKVVGGPVPAWADQHCVSTPQPAGWGECFNALTFEVPPAYSDEFGLRFRAKAAGLGVKVLTLGGCFAQAFTLED